MKVLVLLGLAVASAFAAPDIGLGYRYQIPSTSYGTPISSSDASLVNPTRQYYHVDVRGSIPKTVNPTIPSTNFQTPIREYTSFTGGLVSPSGIHGSSTFGQRGPSGTFGISGTTFTQGGNSGTFTGSSSSGSVGSLDSRGRFQTRQGEVQRHLYFYSAPEEPEQVRPRIELPQIAPKKDVKIIFIKVPTYRAPEPIQIPLQPQNEEKTLVYVLVKNPEEPLPIDIPTPAPTKPSKPEVYFIKYKTQQDAQQVISNVQNGLGHSGIGANSLEGDREFLNTINQESIRDNGVSLTSLSGSVDRRIGDTGATTLDGGSGGGSVDVSITGGTTFTRGPGDGSIKVGVTGSSTLTDGSIKTGVTGGSTLNDGVDDGSDVSVSSVGGSTTASSVGSVTLGSRTSGGSGIHQLYGPPAPV